MTSPVMSSRAPLLISALALLASFTVPFAIQARTERAARQANERQIEFESARDRKELLERLVSDLPAFPEALNGYLGTYWRYSVLVNDDDVSESEINRQNERVESCRLALYDASVRLSTDKELLILRFGRESDGLAAAIQAMLDRANPHCYMFHRPVIEPGLDLFQTVTTKKPRYDFRAMLAFTTMPTKNIEKERDEMPMLLKADIERIKTELKALAD